MEAIIPAIETSAKVSRKNGNKQPDATSCKRLGMRRLLVIGFASSQSVSCAAQRLVLAAAAGQARHLRLKITLLARGAYLERQSRCPLQTVLARF